MSLAPLLSPAQQRDSSLHKFNLQTRLPDLKKIKNDSLVYRLSQPYKSLFKTKPALKFNGGSIAYNFYFRSNIDTPYIEKNIAQNHIAGQLNVTLAGALPLQVNFWLRQSNSDIFRDIADVQVSFNSASFRNRLRSVLRERLLAMEPGITDSLTEKWYGLKRAELHDLSNQLQKNFGPQAIAEAHEILRVPRVTWNPHLTDSINTSREDSIKKVAIFLLDNYKKIRSKYDSLQEQVDSLEKLYREGMQKIERYRQMVNGGWKDFASLRNLEHQLKEFGLAEPGIPKKYRWLMGIRRFSLGRSTAQYSELTAKNLSVNGINFEYNSRYYLAVAAGSVNYRFRDFVVSGPKRRPQTMVLVRAGIGILERNYFILSAYHGQKQLFANSVPGRPSAITISGLSAESRWQLNRTTWLTAEIAKSIAPDVRNIPAQENSKLDFSDRASQGMAFRLFSFLPQTNSRIEAFYKHTGANFQSFNNFQTNADMESWYIRLEQNFFKRKLRIAGALRKNEFSNPFIAQNYKANSIFKSITASFRMRNWPVISVGYQPMSQLTYMGDHIAENRFQTLNTTLYYLYKVSDIRTASTAMFNQFFNNSSDTGFIYYNATNFYWTQHFFFKSFSTHIGASYTKNSGFVLQVLDGGIQPNLAKLGSVGAGVRVNSFNSQVVKVGGYINANIRLSKRDILYVNYDHGYLPGSSQKLVRNDIATVQFVKNF